MDDQRIIVELQSILQQYGGATGQGNAALPSGAHRTLNQSNTTANSVNVLGAISAQLMISGFSRMISASGNTKVASAIQQGSEWLFLGSRAFVGDPTAIATAGFKLASEAIKLVTSYIEKQKDIAALYNDKDYLLMRYGLITISANTEMSYGKYNRLKLSDRK